MSELKVGDRIQLEGTVRRVRRESRLNEEFGLAWVDVHFQGDTWEDVNKITPEALGCATRIEPEGEAAITGMPVENKVLDLNKPIRRKDNLVTVPYLGLTSSGHVITEDEEGDAFSLHQKELENIPEPKQKASREMVLLDGWKTLVTAQGLCPGDASKIIARGTITLTEGDGMEETK